MPLKMNRGASFPYQESTQIGKIGEKYRDKGAGNSRILLRKYLSRSFKNGGVRKVGIVLDPDCTVSTEPHRYTQGLQGRAAARHTDPPCPSQGTAIWGENYHVWKLCETCMLRLAIKKLYLRSCLINVKLKTPCGSSSFP